MKVTTWRTICQEVANGKGVFSVLAKEILKNNDENTVQGAMEELTRLHWESKFKGIGIDLT